MIEHLKIRDKIMEGKRLGIQEKAEETAVNLLIDKLIEINNFRRNHND